MAVSEVQRGHITDLHHKHRNTPYQANRILEVVRKMFNLAEAWGLREDGSNPCRHVQKYKEKKRERFLTEAEFHRLGQVLNEIAAEGPEHLASVAAIRLLMLTGCRLNEIQTLRWEDIDLEAAELRLRDTKTGARMVPLSTAAVSVLSALPRKEDNPWVIAGKKPGAHLTDIQKPWRRIRSRAELDDVRIHDLRHSFASRALALGESLPMIGKLLGHTQVQTVPIRLMQTHTTCRMLPVAILRTQSTPSGCMRKADRHGSDYRSLCAPGERICEGVRFPGRRQHWYAHHTRRALMGDLRHGFASRALALGESLPMIGKLLGHTQEPLAEF